MTEKFICAECKREIKVFEKYMKHTDETILCLDCYNKLIKNGEIE